MLFHVLWANYSQGHLFGNHGIPLTTLGQTEVKFTKLTRFKRWVTGVLHALSGWLGELFYACLQNPIFENDLKKLKSNSPLAVAYTINMLQDKEVSRNISSALDREYQYTARSQEFGDFQEGIRATVIDKDKNPKWKHANIKEVTQEDLDLFLKPMPRNKMEE